MKLFILLISLLTGIVSGAQSYQVTYTNYGVFDPYTKYGAKIMLKRSRHRLLCSKELSYFYTLVKDSDPLKKQKLDSFSLNHSIYYSPQNKSLFTLNIFPKDVGSLLVADSLKEENWIFTREKKKIKGYNSKMVYRTVNNNDTVFVWYTEEIAYPYGPYNFAGFPGLVLEVEDPANHTRLIATDIKEKTVKISLQPYRVISRKEFHLLYE